MTFEQYFTALRGKKIAVLGLGVSNRPLVRLLLEFGCDVTGCDRTPREKLDAEVLELESAGCKLRCGDTYLDGVEADVLFRTPGMHPGNPAIRGLAEKGAYVTSEMEVFFEVCPCSLIAVTGSDGKTNAKEDRARLMEYIMCADWEARQMMDHPVLKAKLQILSDAIREAFDTEGWEDVRWERFFD